MRAGGPDRREPAVRLFVEASLGPDASLSLTPDQTHYLRNVMRRVPGDEIRLFNGREGEWRGRIESLERRSGLVRIEARTGEQRAPPDLWLLFAPLKAVETRFVVEKATELGAAALLPVSTRHCGTKRVNLHRLRAHAVEAAEQCGRREVPAVEPLQPLDVLLAAWPSGRRLLACDTASERTVEEALKDADPAPWAILVGPEGGFAPGERTLLAGHAAVVRASLGPRILRAETAAAAALACWQALAGDWRT